MTRAQKPAEALWCAGLPLAEEVALRPGQRAALLQLYARARGAMLLYGLLSLSLGPLAVLLANVSASLLGERSVVPLAIAAVTFFLGLPLCIVRALASAKSALPLRKDVDGGVLLTFRGSIAQAKYEDEDPEVAMLIESGLLHRGPEEQALGVLPRSGWLVQVGEQEVPPTRKLHVATTAPSPARSLRYSLPPDVKQVFGAPTGLKRRRIGDSEREELGRHIARLTAVPWTLVALTAFVALTVSSWAVKDATPLQQLTGLGWIVAWVVIVIRHVRSYLLARRLEDDLEVGWVLSWETPEASPAAQQGAPPPFKVAEVLPVSQMDWMIDGKPAAWRRVIQRARGA